MSTATEALLALSEAFRARDLEAALACFVEEAAFTYAGSELGEVACGKEELRDLLGKVFSREVSYSWTPRQVWESSHGPHLLVLAELTGCVHTGLDIEEFAYRISGVLGHDKEDRWRWLLLHGAEPSPGPPP